MIERGRIETGRLSLRLIGDDDADLVFQMFSDPRVARWSGTGQVMTSRDEVMARIERYKGRGGDHPWAGVFVIETAGEPVGLTLLVPLPASQGVDRGDIEIGWHLLPSAWGHGYASEAGAAMIARGLEAGLDELYAVTNPDNERSQAVCRRLGMTNLGLRDDWYDTTLRAFRIRPDSRT